MRYTSPKNPSFSYADYIASNDIELQEIQEIRSRSSTIFLAANSLNFENVDLGSDIVSTATDWIPYKNGKIAFVKTFDGFEFVFHNDVDKIIFEKDPNRLS